MSEMARPLRRPECAAGIDHGERTAAGYLFDPVEGCALCGLPADRHPAIVLGLGHLHDHTSRRTGFVEPSDTLRMAREGARLRGGYEIAGFDAVTGQPTTHLVVTRCACGAQATTTLERAEGARCGACMLREAGRVTALPGYTMTERGTT